MTRLTTDGAEIGDLRLLGATSGNVSATDTQAASGNYSYLLVGSTGVNSYATLNLPSALDELFLRFRIRLTNVGRYDPYFTFYQNNSVTCQLYHNYATNLLELRRNAVQLAVASAPLAQSTWQLVELYLKIANSPNGLFTLKLDGDIVADYTGDTLESTYTTINNLRWMVPGALSQNLYIDDIAVNDTAGATDNSWCGNGRVIIDKIVRNGSVNDFSNNSGAGTANWENACEIPPDGGTSYVYDDLTNTGNQDTYGVDTYDGTDRQIVSVWVEARAWETDVSDGTVNLLLNTGGTSYPSAGLALTTQEGRLVGTRHTVNPYTSNPWSASDINDPGFEIGIEIA